VARNRNRSRSYWTNLAYPAHLTALTHHFNTTPRFLSHILDPGCNPVENVGHLPTLTATQGSYEFRDNGKGMVWDSHQRAGGCDTREPNHDERERAMGYATGTTAATNVTCQERTVILGGEIDSFSLSTPFMRED
jgi:hypothetical protein